MAALTVENLNNAKLDVDHIAEFATSVSPMVIDRFGHLKRSLAGVTLVADNILTGVRNSALATLNGVGYLPPVPYAAGIDMTMATETVQFGAVTYAPILEALPFITGGEFETDKFRVIQGAVKEDVTYKAAGPGATPRPATDKLREIPSLADYASSQQAVDVNDAIYVPPGAFTLPANRYGKPMRGPGALMKPVDQADLSKGSYRYVFPETDAAQRTFGEEYLFALHWQYKAFSGSPTTVPIPVWILVGDSTVHGDYITEQGLLPHNAIVSYLQQAGFEANVTNHGVSGSVVGNFALTDAEIDSAHCIVISYGINNTNGIEAFVNDYRGVLARIRARRTYMQTSVVIKTSNAVGDTQHGRDESQAHEQRQALRQAARDYQCFFFDTAAFLADPRPPASGIWNDTVVPSVRVSPAWMDDPYRSDSAYRDPHSFGCSIHPLEVGNAWIWGRLVHEVMSPGVKRWRSNNLNNLRSVSLSAAALLNTFPKGIQHQRAQSANGFPIDGSVVTFSGADGTGLQILYAYDGVTSLAFRQSNVQPGGGTWANWVFLSVRNVEMPIQGGWSPFTPGAKLLASKNATIVTLSGAISGGVANSGVLLAALPNEYRPSSQKWFSVPCGASMNQTAAITVKPTGEVLIQNCPSNGGLTLDGITFVAA